VPLPEPITALSEALCRLPGIGPRSAERLALHLVQSTADDVRRLAQTLVQAREKIRVCSRCGGLTEADPCAICQDARRDASILCVVERPLDIFALEKAGSFRGLYHVLGGKISPLNGVEPEDLRLAELESRLGRGVTEIVVALSTDVEGDATSFYLAKRLAGKGAKISRLAHGLPAGSGLEFADEVTLSRALEGRREMPA
jgi:recombination protein RecR